MDDRDRQGSARAVKGGAVGVEGLQSAQIYIVVSPDGGKDCFAAGTAAFH
jgi:hypothetical protein